MTSWPFENYPVLSTILKILAVIISGVSIALILLAMLGISRKQFEYNYSPKKPKRWWKRWRTYVLAVNSLTLVAVAWYTCITNQMWKEMQNQERPWIAIANMTIEAPQNNWKLSYEIKNYGKSPASPVIVRAFFELGIPVYSKFPGIAPCMSKLDILPATREEVISVFPDSDPVHQELGLHMKDGSPARTIESQFLVVCASYRDASSNQWHHTRILSVRPAIAVGEAERPLALKRVDTD